MAPQDTRAAVAANASMPHSNEWYRAFSPNFTIREQPAHTKRQLRLLVVGAGAAGLLVAYQAARQLTDVSIAVYEKNDDVGGTWYENSYPGVEIDSPSHSYQWSFRPNPNWSKFMSPGAEVQKYLKDWAVETGLMEQVKLRHTITGAMWKEDEGLWVVTGVDDRGMPFEDKSDILFGCNGPLNNPKFPDVPGIKSFKGQLVHSGRWPKDLSLHGKTVAVIGGSGASGVQIVPAIQPEVAKLVVYLRSRFWAVPGTRSKYVGPDKKNFAYSEELKQRFRDDPELLQRYNLDVEEDLAWLYEGFHINSPLSKAVHAALTHGTELAFGKDAAGRFLPDYGFGCRRSAPVHDFATAVQQPNVEIVQAAVTGFTETGVVDSLGGVHDVDVCVCATSFHAGLPNFDIVGRDGRNLGKEIQQQAKSYLSIMNDGFPNLFYLSSTNAPVNHGAYLPMLEWYVRYAFQLVTHMQRTSIRSFVPTAAAQDDYFVWSHQLMKRLTVSQPCYSWFKSGGEAHGPVTAVYAGSRAHFYEALMEPRLEDFHVSYLNEGNRFGYLGNGFTTAEEQGPNGASIVWYLDVLRKEFAAGRAAHERIPLQKRHDAADTDIVIPKGSRSSSRRDSTSSAKQLAKL